ncbi:helix-turn-helix domain-containing protein [Parvularcula sp. IMCC14364]|uniref:helix-turn-helix transcriptional regulator n=1 Tax=Parvularcula sp. IMCC14364 TaxID=3067902 RepID=UPI0027419496|nr:helix-turn-helix domain-containing protein [Parvularcula sp. IMCC14364]
MVKPAGEYAHPGQFLRHWVLPENEILGVLAKRLGLSRQSLSYILNGTSGITPRVAAQIEAEFGLSEKTLLAMDSAYRLQQKRPRGKKAD